MNTLIGYVRTSTKEQGLSIEAQEAALRAFGCERIFRDVASGALASREALSACLASLEPGQTLVVTRLDRLGRSLLHLITCLNDLSQRGVAFRSLAEPYLDTSPEAGPAAKLIVNLLCCLSEFERSLIRERTMLALAQAREKGRVGGRPRALSAAAVADAERLLASGRTVGQVAATLRVSRKTIYRSISRAREEAVAAQPAVLGPAAATA